MKDLITINKKTHPNLKEIILLIQKATLQQREEKTAKYQDLNTMSIQGFYHIFITDRCTVSYSYDIGDNRTAYSSSCRDGREVYLNYNYTGQVLQNISTNEGILEVYYNNSAGELRRNTG